MTPGQALVELGNSGLTQPEIIDLIQGEGVRTTQATISRIASGSVKNPSFELGAAILAAHDKYIHRVRAAS